MSVPVFRSVAKGLCAEKVGRTTLSLSSLAVLPYLKDAAILEQWDRSSGSWLPHPSTSLNCGFSFFLPVLLQSALQRGAGF